MNSIRIHVVAALAVIVGFASSSLANQVPAQKGNACAAVWDTVTATAVAGSTPKKPWLLTCTDGDPACDTDLSANGQCVISINLCEFGSGIEGCTPESPDAAVKLGGPAKKNLVGLVAPPAPVTAQTCGTPGAATLKLKGKKKDKPSKKLTLLVKFKSATGKGVNKLKVQCTKTGTPLALCPAGVQATGQPFQLTFQVPANGTDLDNGFTGTSHNFPVVMGSKLVYCLSNCDSTTDSACDGVGPTGEGSLNGPTFGSPLPLLAAGVPVCVVNRYQPGDLHNTVDLATGAAQGQVNLFSDVYITQTSEVCPRCEGTSGQVGATGGHCSSGSKSPGSQCTVEGFVRVAQAAGDKDYPTSSSCVPAKAPESSLNIQLPLTTGATSQPGSPGCPGQTQDDSCGSGTCVADSCTGAACVSRDSQNRCIDSKGGISQACCSGSSSTPCFPTKNGGSIERTGFPFTLSPAWPDPTYPKTSTGDPGSTQAALFCIDATGSGVINVTTGLPGPGALLLPATVTVLAAP